MSLGNCCQVAPYDFLVADEALPEAEATRARAEAATWLCEGVYALLPYSSLLLTSVPDLAARPPVQAMRPAATAVSPAALSASSRRAVLTCT